MKRNNFLALMTGMLSLFILSSAASAEVSWDAVKKKAAKGEPYSVVYKYTGPRGASTLDYAYTPTAIRTDVKAHEDRSKVGSVIVWDKTWNNGEKVRAKTGGGVIVRTTTHAEVKDTPFHRSVFTMVIDQANAVGKPVASASGTDTLFNFGNGKYRIWANDAGEIKKTQRKDGSQEEVRTFTNLKWNSNPKTGF